MYALIALFALSLVLCLVLTPLCRDLCLKFRLVDVPDNVRRIHTREIPRIGGVPIALAYVGALGIMLAFAPSHARIVIQHEKLLYALLPAAGIVFLTGLIDDLIGLKPWQKLFCQFIGATWAVLAGARITFLDGQPHSALFAIPFSICWLIACTNAFNLIDGLDGLASGVGIFATLTTLLAALLQGNWGLAMATVPLAGCLFGFLRYNFNPASIFLGDSGSLTIGFLLGCFGIIWSQKSATFLGMLAPAMALSLPLFDAGLSIGRRFLRNQPIFQADLGHIHHRLLGFGLHPRLVAIILYAACGVAATLSLLQSSLSNHLGGIIILLFCALAFFAIKRLGYIEFITAGKVLRTGGVLRLVRQEIYLRNFEDSLSRATTPSECWTAIRGACLDLHFASAYLVFEGEIYQEIFDSFAAESAWQFSKSLGRKGRMTLTRMIKKDSPSLMSSFFHILQASMESKTCFEKPEPKSIGMSA